MVFRHRLDNGISVILEPIEGVVSVSVGLWVRSGSRDERAGEYGYAHFIEHMLFKGTREHTAEEIARIVDRVGGQHNAATNREYTCYYISVVSDHLELAVRLLAEMYYDSLFNAQDMNKEKNVIMEEIRMYEDTPDELIHDLFMECMLEGHPLSRPILGTYDSIRAATRDGLVSFYQQQYRNDNAVIAVAGRFRQEEARSLIERYFSRPAGQAASCEAMAQRPRRIAYRHCEKDLEQVHFCLGTNGIARDDSDRWALYLMSTVLGGSMSSRLFQNIREKEGIAYSIYSFHSSYSDQGVFGIYCATLPENYLRARDLIVQECRSMIDKGITEQELQDAKDFMKGNLALSLESVEVRMGQIAKDEITFHRSFSFDEIVGMINAVTMDDFRRVCGRIFSNRELSVVSVGSLAGLKVPESGVVI